MYRLPPALVTAGAIGVAITAVSSSAPLIAFAAAPALAIAFWRNALAAAVLVPVAIGARSAEMRATVAGDRRREGVFGLLAGVALAAHFATWMPSVQLSSVATATALVATQPVWQGLIARAQGRRLPVVAWLGIGVAVSGAALATGADIDVSPAAVFGDILAAIGGLAAAVYTALGERARTRLSTTTYTSICYGVCAAVLVVICLTAGVPLAGYDTSTWAAILALVAGAQLLGHSMFNYVLRRVSTTTVSVLILLEVPGAALLAWLWLEQVPRAAALPGLSLLVIGVAVVVLGGARARRPAGGGAQPPAGAGAQPPAVPALPDAPPGVATRPDAG